MRFAFVLSLVATVLSGCAGGAINAKYTPLGSESHTVGSVYQATAADGWQLFSSTFDVDFIVHWTADRSHSANFAHFIDISDGGALFTTSDPDFPLFRSDMSPEQVAAMLKESMELRGMPSIETENIRPAKFATLPGFKFDTNYVRSDGVEGQGIALGTIVNSRLQLIYFTSSVETFGQYVEDAEFMMKSLTLQ